MLVLRNCKKNTIKAIIYILSVFLLSSNFFGCVIQNKSYTDDLDNLLRDIKILAPEFEVEKIDMIEKNGMLTDFLTELSDEIKSENHDYSADEEYFAEMKIDFDDKVKILKEKALGYIEMAGDQRLLRQEGFEGVAIKYLYEIPEEIGVSGKANEDLNFRALYAYLNFYDYFCTDDELYGKKKIYNESELDDFTIREVIQKIVEKAFFEERLEAISKKYLK